MKDCSGDSLEFILAVVFACAIALHDAPKSMRPWQALGEGYWPAGLTPQRELAITM